jgi:hypothetical protein
LIDGELLPDAEARALWERFSDWMEDHRGDLAGFAASEGLASVHPGVDGGRPVLVGSKRDTNQQPYASAKAVSVRANAQSERGGSPDRQKGAPGRPGRHPQGHSKRGKK